MKKLLLVILSVFCLTMTFAQDEIISAITDDNYNFKIVDGDVIWQFVYETDKSQNEIIEYFKRSNTFKVVSADSTNVKGYVDRKSLDFQKCGYSRMELAIYINNPISYTVNISVKDNRYRVTIHNVVFASTTNMSFGGVSTNSNSQYTLTEMSYNHRRSKFKDMFFSQNAASALANVFYDTYLMKSNYITTSDDW